MKFRFAMAAVALTVLVTGCGTRVKDQTADGNNAVSGQGAGGGATTGTGTPGGSGSGTNANMFGSLPVPCGPKTSADANTATGLGVTENEIHVTTISDPGGAKPGLDQGMFDSMKAFAQWCNGFGGINGRKLIVDFKDAKLVQYKDRIAEACQDSFALVGGLGVLDELGAQDAVDCGLPNVPGAAVSPKVSGSSLTIQPLPNPPQKYNVGPGLWVKSVFPDSITQASSIYSKFATTEVQSNRLVEGYEQIGYKFVYRQSANVNESNWGPLVVAMKNNDVKYFTLTSSFEEIIPLQKEMANQGYHPEVTELETNFYDARYPEQALAQGADTTSTYVRLTVWPFEDADQNPAMKSYLEQLQKAVPDAVPAELGVQSWSAGLLFATAAKAAGGNLTRQTLMDQLRKITTWNGGGLHGTSNPGDGIPATCFVMMKVQDGKFVRAYPLPDKDAAVYNNDTQKGMACPSQQEAIVPLKGDYGVGAEPKGK